MFNSTIEMGVFNLVTVFVSLLYVSNDSLTEFIRSLSRKRMPRSQNEKYRTNLLDNECDDYTITEYEMLSNR